MKKNPDRDKQLRKEFREIIRQHNARQALFRACLKEQEWAIKLWYDFYDPPPNKPVIIQ